MFKDLMTDDAYIIDIEGNKTGPFKTKFGTEGILHFFDSKLEIDVDVGYKIFRTMSNKKEEFYIVTECNFQEAIKGFPPRYVLKIYKGDKVLTQNPLPPVHHTTYNITGSQGFQAGNQNTQNITDSFNELIQRVESSSVSAKEKEEAKGLIKKTLDNPLVAAILGGVVSGATGLLI